MRVAHVRHNFFNVAIALGFQLHQDVAVVGLGHGGKSQLQARAPRCAFHFRSFAQHLFQMTDDAVGFRERTACGHEVVEDESPFVHLRQKIRIRIVEANERNCDQGRAENHQHQRTFQRAAQPALMEVDYPQEESA